VIEVSHDVSEIGRELQVNELKVKGIVVLQSSKRPGDFCTLWVQELGQDFVVFLAATLRVSLLCKIREDGALMDDAGTVLRVYEYLGKE
jgi:hypothetical protein